MLTTETKYIAVMIRHAAASVIEYSSLNVDRAARELHTDRLVEDFWNIAEGYLAENTKSDTLTN